MALLDTGSPVIALRRSGLLPDLRIVDDELLVFGNNEGSKVKSIGNLGVIRNVEVLRNLTNIIVSVYGLQLLNYEIIFRKHARSVKIKNLDIGKSFIESKRVYDIAFREGDTLAEARRRAILEGTHPKGVDTTAYDPENWKMEDDYIEPGTNENNTAAVLIDGEEEPRIMAMISEEYYFFPAAKKNGNELILIDTGAGVTCFNLRRLYDAIDWSRTGSLRSGN